VPVKGAIIGVDLDGVCADFYGKMREIAAEWFERSPDELPMGVSYGMEEWGIGDEEQYQSLHRFAVTQRALFETMPIIPGARKYLRLLSDEGARIRIITHRLFIHHFHREAVSQTVDWLDKHAIPYWDLCFMKDKTEVGADVYVEDTPVNILALRAKGLYTICFVNSTNSDIEPPRASSWSEVYELIHRRLG
jgi:beta-phosphoglucomutase-like phosphatase (HAD superfamily)